MSHEQEDPTVTFYAEELTQRQSLWHLRRQWHTSASTASTFMKLSSTESYFRKNLDAMRSTWMRELGLAQEEMKKAHHASPLEEHITETVHAAVTFIDTVGLSSMVDHLIASALCNKEYMTDKGSVYAFIAAWVKEGILWKEYCGPIHSSRLPPMRNLLAPLAVRGEGPKCHTVSQFFPLPSVVSQSGTPDVSIKLPISKAALPDDLTKEMITREALSQIIRDIEKDMSDITAGIPKY